LIEKDLKCLPWDRGRREEYYIMLGIGTLFNVGIHLNEAHNIKNRNTKAAVACCELEEKYRCALNI